MARGARRVSSCSSPTWSATSWRRGPIALLYVILFLSLGLLVRDVGAGVACAARARGGGRGRVRPPRQRPRRAVAPRGAARRAGRGPGRRDHRGPRHPAVGRVPRAGDARLRHHARADVLHAGHHVRPDLGRGARDPPEHRADRPRLLLRGPRRGGDVFDLRRRAHARPPRPPAARAVATRRSRSTPRAPPSTSPRVLVFCISAFLAGIFGALYAGFVGSINGTSFPSFNSLTIIAVVVLVARRRAVVRGHRGRGVPLIPGYITSSNIQTYLQIFFGLAVIVVGLQARHPASVPVAVAPAPRPPRRAPARDAPPAPAARGRRRFAARRRRRSTPPGDRGRARARRPHRALRRPRRGRRPEPARRRSAASPGSSAPTAPARPPRSTRAPAWCARPTAESCSTATT